MLPPDGRISPAISNLVPVYFAYLAYYATQIPKHRIVKRNHKGNVRERGGSRERQQFSSAGRYDQFFTYSAHNRSHKFAHTIV